MTPRFDCADHATLLRNKNGRNHPAYPLMATLCQRAIVDAMWIIRRVCSRTRRQAYPRNALDMPRSKSIPSMRSSPSQTICNSHKKHGKLWAPKAHDRESQETARARSLIPDDQAPVRPHQSTPACAGHRR